MDLTSYLSMTRIIVSVVTILITVIDKFSFE